MTSPIVRVEVTYRDGRVMELTGEGAELMDRTWDAALLRELPWEDITPKAVTLEVDPERVAMGDPGTGIFVRAIFDGQWGSYDIATLKREGLIDWLRSRGGRNDWAENVVALLLGHQP